MRLNGYHFVLMTALISGFAIFLGKFLVTGLDSFALTSVFTTSKNAFVAIMLCILLISTKELKTIIQLPWAQMRKLIVIGVVGGSIPFLLFFYGLSITSAAKAAFTHKIMFIFVAIFAFFFLKERLNRTQIAGTLGLLVGVFFLIGAPTSLDLGVLLIFIGALFWSSETIISKYALKEMSANTVAFGRMFFGSLILLAVLGAMGELGSLITLNANQGLGIIVSSVLLFGYVFTWYHGLQLIKASEAAAILVLGSVVTALLSLNVTAEQFLGSILIIVSIIFIVGVSRASEKALSGAVKHGYATK